MVFHMDCAPSSPHRPTHNQSMAIVPLGLSKTLLRENLPPTRKETRIYYSTMSDESQIPTQKVSQDENFNCQAAPNAKKVECLALEVFVGDKKSRAKTASDEGIMASPQKRIRDKLPVPMLSSKELSSKSEMVARYLEEGHHSEALEIVQSVLDSMSDRSGVDELALTDPIKNIREFVVFELDRIASTHIAIADSLLQEVASLPSDACEEAKDEKNGLIISHLQKALTIVNKFDENLREASGFAFIMEALVKSFLKADHIEGALAVLEKTRTLYYSYRGLSEILVDVCTYYAKRGDIRNTLELTNEMVHIVEREHWSAQDAVMHASTKVLHTLCGVLVRNCDSSDEMALPKKLEELLVDIPCSGPEELHYRCIAFGFAMQSLEVPFIADKFNYLDKNSLSIKVSDWVKIGVEFLVEYPGQLIFFDLVKSTTTYSLSSYRQAKVSVEQGYYKNAVHIAERCLSIFKHDRRRTQSARAFYAEVMRRIAVERIKEVGCHIRFYDKGEMHQLIKTAEEAVLKIPDEWCETPQRDKLSDEISELRLRFL